MESYWLTYKCSGSIIVARKQTNVLNCINYSVKAETKLHKDWEEKNSEGAFKRNYA